MYILIERPLYNIWIQSTRLVVLFPQKLFDPNNLRAQVSFYTMLHTLQNHTVSTARRIVYEWMIYATRMSQGTHFARLGYYKKVYYFQVMELLICV
jgi:hypothetical protein